MCEHGRVALRTPPLGGFFFGTKFGREVVNTFVQDADFLFFFLFFFRFFVQ